jgi:acyl carrier protein
MTIEERVKQIVAAQFCMDVGDVDLAADMIEKHEMDSLDQVEIVIATEDEFGVEIPDDDMFAIKTAQQLIDLVKAKMPA